MLEAMDELLQAYHKYRVNTKDIEKVRAHIVRKLLMMEREGKKLNIENEANKVRLNSLYGIFAYQDTDGLKVKREEKE